MMSTSLLISWLRSVLGIFLLSHTGTLAFTRPLSTPRLCPPTHARTPTSARDLQMKWIFTRGQGNQQSLGDIGGRGSQGEFYYVQTQKARLSAPKEAVGGSHKLCLFPRNNVLPPFGEEFIGVYEMRYRQMLHDIQVTLFLTPPYS